MTEQNISSENVLAQKENESLPPPQNPPSVSAPPPQAAPAAPSAPVAQPITPVKPPLPPSVPAEPSLTAAPPSKPVNPFFSRTDLWIAGLIGFLCALLILPIAQNLAISNVYAFSLVIILPILSLLGMWVATLIAPKLKFVYQLAKFVLVGALNTFIDWGILNVLIFLTSATSGYLYTVFKGVSFLVATSNSYAWNKFWTFKKPVGQEVAVHKKTTGKEFLQFFVISVIGFLFNVGMATFIVNVWGPQSGIDERIWANIGALGGTLCGLLWNFLGYKLIVFKD